MRPGPTLFILIETIGILSFAINAMIAGRTKNLSSLGLFVAAAATALGGGTLRDLLLGPSAQPFFWVANPFYVVAIFLVALGYANLAVVQGVIGRRDVIIKETTELIAFASLASLGAMKAFNILSASSGAGWLDVLHVWILASFFGAMSAAFGSVIRDMIINEFPGALRPGVWSLEAAFIGSAAAVAARFADVSQPWALLIGFAVIAAIRARVVFGAKTVKA